MTPSAWLQYLFLSVFLFILFTFLFWRCCRNTVFSYPLAIFPLVAMSFFYTWYVLWKLRNMYYSIFKNTFVFHCLQIYSCFIIFPFLFIFQYPILDASMLYFIVSSVIYNGFSMFLCFSLLSFEEYFSIILHDIPQYELFYFTLFAMLAIHVVYNHLEVWLGFHITAFFCFNPLPDLFFLLPPCLLVL